MAQKRAQILAFFLLKLLFQESITPAAATPLNCTDTKRLCTSFIAFKPTTEQTLPVIQSMFDVLREDITFEGNGRDYVFIKKNCSCASGVKTYLTNTTFTVRENNGSVYDLVVDAYNGLAYFPSNFTRAARKGAVVSLKLACGCSSGLWNYLMSYVMEDGDSVESLSSRFGISMDSIEAVNGIANPDNVTIGELYYIPLNSAPGEPYLVTDVVPVPGPAPSADNFAVVDQVDHKSHIPYWWIIGSLSVGLVLVIFVVLLFVCLKPSVYSGGSRGSHPKDSEGKNSHKFHILRNSSFCCASGRSICGNSGNSKHHIGESSNRQINIPSVIGTDVFDVDKPVVFKYEEILSSTEGFSESNLLGHGTYGSVYYGLLRDQEVAIKKNDCYKN